MSKEQPQCAPQEPLPANDDLEGATNKCGANAAPSAPTPPIPRDANGRYIKGYTGNAKGRPKKRILAWSQRQKDLADLREAYRMVPVTTGGKTEYITMREAMFRGMMMKAANGNEKAFLAVEKAISQAQHRHECRNPGTFHWLEECELEADHPRIGTKEQFQELLNQWAKKTRR